LFKPPRQWVRIAQKTASSRRTSRSPIEDGVLTIQARREDSAESNDGYLRRERHWGSRYRQVALPWEVKADQAKATFDRGVLTLTIPKAPSAQPIKVQVNGTEAKQISAAKK
jgi:HSP20 family protein